MNKWPPFLCVLVAGLAACGDDTASGGAGASGGGGSGNSGGQSSGGQNSGGQNSGGNTVGCDAAADTVSTDAPLLAIAGEENAAFGIFDPSLAYAKDADVGVMSYSRVVSEQDIHTAIATSTDAGATWTRVAEVNSAGSGTVPVTNDPLCVGSCAGSFVHEVSSIVLDPDDAAAARYKLFSHRYLVARVQDPQSKRLVNVSRYDIGHIALQTAPAPEGPWTEPTAIIGWAGTSPFSQTNIETIATDEPELADCIAITEPAALSFGGDLYLAAGCVTGDTIRIILFRSTDHAATWSYRGLLLDGDESSCLGGSSPRVNAPHLFTLEDEVLLLASPSTDDAYRGCSVMRVDLATATIERTEADEPAIVRKLDTDPQGFTGACAYAEGATALGYLVPWADVAATPVFRIAPSHIAAP